MGKGKPGSTGMMIQHFHGVPSRCALIARWTIASPILFSTFTSFTIVLVPRPEMSKPRGRVAWKKGKEGRHVAAGRTYEVMKNWFSMYTKCSES